jgi:hypothetical protein
LLADADRPVGFGREVEPADFGFGKGADRRHRGATDALFIGEIGDGLEGFLALVEDQDTWSRIRTKVRSSPLATDFDFIKRSRKIRRTPDNAHLAWPQGPPRR